ncbi:ApeA N-terminal domain 1-containing protein [Mucilaginibacter aquatilis]|uniref:Uncharacterized protein n=1 Tax=Mucilaginibacter aquatilis TaxID=1517760 RepID=A0A6I4IH44_9SPHI|nr:HEPN domain-containing protein [Mucilaginibacter aquatilis]MVN92679.1 hypothetical protein [Mucilaginibacter aquatilis]
MNDPLELKGYWFLPERQNERIAGMLKYLPNGKITLELIGSLNGREGYIEDIMLEGWKESPVIYGEASDASRVTLLNCHPYGIINYSCSFPMQSFSVEKVIRGIHLNGFDDPVFNEIIVNIPFLTEWMNFYQIGLSFPIIDNKLTGFDLSYHPKDVKDFYVEIDEEWKLKIEFYAYPPQSKFEEELIIKQCYRLSIASNSNFSLKEFLYKASRFKSFLKFGLLKDVGFKDIYLFSPNHYQELADKTKHYYPVQLLYRQHEKPLSVKKARKEALFTFDMIEPTFEILIREWFSFGKGMAPILKHLVESIKEKESFGSVDFLVVIQALEGFCNRFRPQYKPTGRGNKLKQQLEALVNEFLFVPGIKKQNIDVEAAANSRHYYSHFYSRQSGDKVVEGKALFELYKSLKALLICCVLSTTGFKNDELQSIMKNYFDN